MGGCCGVGSGAQVFPSGGGGGLVSFIEIPFLANEVNTQNSTGQRVGGRLIDMTQYPATIGSLSRVVTLVADLDIAGAPTSSNARLYNVTDSEEVTGSEVVGTTTTNTEVSSAALTVGGAAGNIRDDHPAQYAALLKMVGGGAPADRALATNIRLVITYA